jgi:hypothetical protein
MAEAMSEPVPSIADAIRDNAAGLKKASNDAGSVEQHPIADQIVADRYLASKQAVSRRNRGLRISRIVSPGTGGTA